MRALPLARVRIMHHACVHHPTQMRHHMRRISPARSEVRIRDGEKRDLCVSYNLKLFPKY